MILSSLLLYLGTTLAAPHLPQTINCPNSDIHVYINGSAVDRTEYTFVNWNADSIQDCVHKCFGNHFCYSIRYDTSLEQNCGLYYFAAYNCSNQLLTKASGIEYKGGSVTLDCIRCPGNGEFVTAPPFSSIGEQTIVADTSLLSHGENIKGTAVEITHNSENEGKTHSEVEKGENKDEKEEEEMKEGSGEGSGERTYEDKEGTVANGEGKGMDTVTDTVLSEQSTTESTEEQSTVGGEEEATTVPTSGESNGEAELREETTTVEGSGEGSGEIGEIGEQEEEEPVTVKTETTTIWNGHVTEKRVCDGHIRFIPTSQIDLDTVQLLINSTKANSPSECAKICYEHSCGFAYYEPSTFMCQFMVNTEDMVDSSTCPTNHKDAKYQAEFGTDVASTMDCVICAKDSEVSGAPVVRPPLTSPRRGIAACIISFQVEEGDHSGFPFYKSEQVQTVNECARKCFIGGCTQSVYNPKTNECRLGSNPRDTCGHSPLVSKSHSPEEVLLQCFRCVPTDEWIVTKDGPVRVSASADNESYQEGKGSEESIDESATKSTKGENEEAVTSHPEEESTSEGEKVTVPSSEETEGPYGSTVAPEGEQTTVASEEEETTVAVEGEESTVVPEEETTVAVEGEESTVVPEEETTVTEGEETTIGEQVEEGSGVEHGEGEGEGSGIEEESTTQKEEKTYEGEEEGVTTSSPEEGVSEGPAAIVKDKNDESPLILASEDIDFGKSCVIKFQSAPFTQRPSTLKAPFEKTFPVDSIELCATRCFQDGCSGAKYEIESSTCHLSYDESQSCDRTELRLRLEEVKEDTWIHCVNCYPEKNVVKGILGDPLEKNETVKDQSMLAKVIGAVSGVAGNIAEKVTGEGETVLGHGCIVNFQISASSEINDAIEYLPSFSTRYAHRCATKCFQEGCAAALFNPETNECSLGYGRFVKCSNKPLLKTSLELKESVIIHCMSCIHHKSGDGGVDLVVLSPDDARIHTSESQDLPPEETVGGDATVPPTEEGRETTVTSEEGEATVPSEGEGATTVPSEEEGATTVSSEEGAESKMSGEGSGEQVYGKEGKGKVDEIPLESEVIIPGGVNLDGELSKVQVNGDRAKGVISHGEGATEETTTLPSEGSTATTEVAHGAEGTHGAEGAQAGEAEVTTESAEGETSTVAGEGEGATTEGAETTEGAHGAEGAEGAHGAEGAEGAHGAEGAEGAHGAEGAQAGEAEVTTESAEGETSTVAGEGEGATTEGAETTEGAHGAEEQGEATTEQATTEGGEEGAHGAVGAEGTEEVTTEGVHGVEESKDEEATTVTSEEETTVTNEEGTTESSEGGIGVIHPSKEMEPTPLHPVGEEVEVGEATTQKETTTTNEEEEGPAFVQGEPSEDEEKESEGHKEEDKEALIHKHLSTIAPKTQNAMGTVSASEDTTETTVAGADQTTVATTEESVTKEGLIEKALSTASPNKETTYEGEVNLEKAETTTVGEEVTVEGGETSTVEGAESSTVEGGESEATTVEMAESIDEKEEEKGEEKEEMIGKGTITEDLSHKGESTVSPSHDEISASGEITTQEPTGEESVIGKTEVSTPESAEGKAIGEGMESVSTSATTEASVVGSTTSEVEKKIEPSTVPTPADLAKETHGEHGGAEFGETTTANIGESNDKSGLSTVSTEETTTTGLAEGAKAIEEGIEKTLADASHGVIDSSTHTAPVPSPADLAKETHGEHGGAEFGSTTIASTGESTDETGASTVNPVEVTSSVAEGAKEIEEGIEKSLSGVSHEGVNIGEGVTDSSTHTVTQSVPSPADLAKGTHGEHGGAEFGDTHIKTLNQSDEEKAAEESSTTSEVEKKIEPSTVPSPSELATHLSTVSPVESSSLVEESIDGGIDKALEKVEGDGVTKTTTEPPVQAVKDLLDALASGDFDRALFTKKNNITTPNGTEAHQMLKGNTQLLGDFATPVNQKHECTTGQLRFTTFELVDLSTRFEVDAIAYSLPHCARLCYEVGCTLAAYSRFPRPLCLMHFEKEGNGHRCNEETNRTSYWTYSSLQQVVAIDCIICDGQTFFEHDHNVDITTLHAIDDSILTVQSPQGVSKSCDGGRLEFQYVPSGSLPRLNVTNDVPARTPADCARRCLETKGCTTAGYIPTPSAEISNGVCLLTSDDEVCISNDDSVPQHASVTAFVISCIKCTRCSYNLSHMSLSPSTAKFQHIATVKTIGQCAELCNSKKCSYAQYDSTTSTCALSMESTLDNDCNRSESSISIKSSLPIKIECVQCREE